MKSRQQNIKENKYSDENEDDGNDDDDEKEDEEGGAPFYHHSRGQEQVILSECDAMLQVSPMHLNLIIHALIFVPFRRRQMKT